MRSSAPHLAVAFVLTLGSVARAQGLRHVQPERDAEVPTSGFPTWIENLTVGSPVSDFGSHAGVKASLTTDAPMHAKSLLGAAHYSGFQTNAAQVDQSLVYVVEGGRPLLAPPASREVRFHPWGWEEVARGDDLEARGAVTTLSTDAFLFVVRLVNRGSTTRTLSPRVALLADGDGVHEGMFPFHASFMQKWRASLDASRGAAKVFYRRGTPLAAFAWDRMRMDRQIAATPPIVRVRDGLTPYAANPRRWTSTLELEARTLAPGASLDVAFVIGYGADDAAAARVLDGARPALNDPLAALRAVRAGWDADLAALPKPHAADADQARLWTVAYAGLRHNRFAATTSGQGTMNTASKIHFNAFYVWDGAMAALGESNWDPALGRELLQELFRAQLPEGHLHYAVGPDRKPVNGLIRGTSQPPIHGWVMERVLERGGVTPAAVRPWLQEIYDRSGRWLDFFARERDADRDGSFGFANALETGWDDTPRYPGLHPAPEVNIFGIKLVLGNLSGLLPVKGVEALDLNSWLVSYYRSMARWAESLGKPRAEVDGWSRKANELAGKVEAEMWDGQTGTFRDTITKSGRTELVRVDTPVVAFPLFLGVTRDPARVRSTVERYILDANKAYGDPDDPARPYFPVPSVAYDSPEYDHANDGYYWRGQSWLIPAYACVEALYKHGWEAEARELKRRILRGVTKAHANGIYETYDALSSRIGFGSGSLTGAGEPAAFLIGLSCAPVAELLLDRFERERFVRPDDVAFTGHLLEARELASDRLFLKVDHALRAIVPFTRLATRDGAPLLAPTAAGYELTLTDPWRNCGPGPVRVTLPGRAGWRVFGVAAGGGAVQLTATVASGTGASGDLVLDLERTDAGPYARYVLVPPGAPIP